MDLQLPTHQLTTPEDIRQLGVILGVWAHPDDESFLAAGVMATAARNGQLVACVTATKGEAGSQDVAKWPLETLGETRVAEMKAALEVLGIEHHSWLGYPDGDCATVTDAEAVPRIAALIERYRPDTIVTFGPEGLTGHPDHRAVSRWACLAAHGAKTPPRVLQGVHTPEQYERYLKGPDEQLNMYFNIDQPPLVPREQCAVAFALPRDILVLKYRSWEVMASQSGNFLKVFKRPLFNNAFGVEYFVECQQEGCSVRGL